MSAKWEYLYETPPYVHATNFPEKFNQLLNARAAEDWELMSVQYYSTHNSISAALIWRRQLQDRSAPSPDRC